MPLTINCWPESTGNGVINVNIEYSLEAENVELQNVVIIIPLNSTEAPEILSVDGIHRHNSRYQRLEWQLDLISADNSTGAMEFNIVARDEECFFPVEVSFTSSDTLLQLDVTDVTFVDTGEGASYAASKSLAVGDGYVVVSES